LLRSGRKDSDGISIHPQSPLVLPVAVGRPAAFGESPALYELFDGRQPYVVPANTVRFMAPPGRLTVSARWEAGRATFRTAQGSKMVAEHTFTSGVPSAGNETIRMNLYVYDDGRHPPQHDSEVGIEKFEFLP
jgi:hypothetical protein